MGYLSGVKGCELMVMIVRKSHLQLNRKTARKTSNTKVEELQLLETAESSF